MVVIGALPRAGAERVVSRLTREWSRRHDVIVALFDGSRSAYEVGGRVVDLQLPAGGGLLKTVTRVGLRALRLAATFRRERPDRVISFMERANIPSIIAAALTGMLGRLCVSVRNNPASIRACWRMLIPVMYRLPDRVVAPSEGVRRALVRIGLSRAKISVIHNPVDVRNSHPRLGTDIGGRRYVLGAGRLHRQKGFDRLLRAFAQTSVAGLELVILGEGAERGRLESLARQLGVASRVHLPGVVADVESWYRGALCFVLSSRYEGWPNVLMEAMAAGCPVVSVDCPYGPAEILDGGERGLLVAEHDLPALSRAITRVVCEESLRARLSADGSRHAAAFAPEKIAHLWLGRDPNGRSRHTSGRRSDEQPRCC